jgi:hypothetical protein
MKKYLLIACLFIFSSNILANSLEITSWYRLNSGSDNDLSAEVCFKLDPKPTTPILAEIVIDKGTRVQGVYTTWVGKRGAACKVVSTQRGKVEVEVENYLSSSKDL